MGCFLGRIVGFTLSAIIPAGLFYLLSKAFPGLGGFLAILLIYFYAFVLLIEGQAVDKSEQTSQSDFRRGLLAGPAVFWTIAAAVITSGLSYLLC